LAPVQATGYGRSMDSLRKSAPTLAVAMAIASILDAIFYTGYFASDDSGYLSAAAVVLRGGLMPSHVGSVRLGMTLPVVALYWLSDGSVHLVAAAFALLHPLLVVLVLLAGTVAHGAAVGRLAAMLTAICPFLYVFAGAILPDLITTSWIMVSLLLVLIAERRWHLGWPTAAGIALGIGYSAKETALVMIVPALATFLLGARPDPRRAILRCIVFLGAIAAVVMLETLALRALTGEWLTHLGVLLTSDTQEHLAEVAGQQGFGPLERFHTVFMELKLIGPLWIWMLVLFSIAYTRMPDRSLPILCFAVWAFAYLTWGTASLSSYRPAPIQPRYFSVVFVPASLLTARVLMAAGAWLKLSWLRSIVLVILLGALLAGEVARNRGRAGNIYAAWIVRGVEEAYRSAAERRPELPVVLSPEYQFSLDGLFAEHKPRNLITMYSWDRELFPAPPFFFVELGNRYSEAKLRSMLQHGPTTITTFDIIYPRPRLERLWSGIEAFFVVGPAPVDGTWYWHTHETLVQLIEPGVRDVPGRARPIASAPLYPDQTMTTRWIDSGHVIAWPETMTIGGAQFFDRLPLEMPPTHDGSRLTDLDSSACFDISYLAIEGSARVESELHVYGNERLENATSKVVVELTESSSTTASLAVDAAWPIRSFRIFIAISPIEGAGELLVGHPRQIICERSGDP
jgi:hypothetical protein